jgi:antitoxin Phd
MEGKSVQRGGGESRAGSPPDAEPRRSRKSGTAEGVAKGGGREYPVHVYGHKVNTRLVLTKSYSIVEVRSRLSSVLREVERGTHVELTRRGRPVAVVLSARDYERLRGGSRTFTQALANLKRKGFRGVELPDGFIESLRDRSSGREVGL